MTIIKKNIILIPVSKADFIPKNNILIRIFSKLNMTEHFQQKFKKYLKNVIFSKNSEGLYKLFYTKNVKFHVSQMF